MAVGCYTDLYLPTSFKGFSVAGMEALDTSSEHGRRGAEGEFPFSENTAYADMGRRIRTYSVRIRFKANSHIADAQAFAAVCESSGPGILIHPTSGAVRVGCKSAKITDNPVEEQGVSYADCDFVEANEWVTGLSLVGSLLGFDISPLLTVATSLFEDTYDYTNVYIFRQPEVRARVSETATFLRNLFVEALGTESNSDTWAAISELDFSATSTPVLNNQTQTRDLLFKTMAAIDAKSSSLEKIDRFKRVANFASVDTTLTGQAEKMLDGLNSALRVASAAYIIRGALEYQPETLAQAFSHYDTVATLLDDEAANALLIDDTLANVQIRNAFADSAAALLTRAYNLPALITYNFGGGVSSLFAAYEIYGDANKRTQLELSNPTKWPWALGPDVIAVSPNG